MAPVLKADAYGCGADRVAARLAAAGARRLFVARLEEGLALRAALGAGVEILVLDGVAGDDGAAAASTREAGLVPVLSAPGQIAAWRSAGGVLADAALHVDTGMNRLGVSLEAAGALSGSGERPRLLMSHLACAGRPADPLNAVQARRFAEARRLFPGTPGSLANSEGIFLGPAFRHDLVRPGLLLYGGGPFGAPHPGIRAVATLEARILQVRQVAAGESVGYEAAWRARRETRVAIVQAGYADGVLRAGARGGYGWLAGERRPILGRISMDLLALDVTRSPEARPGDRVELLGPHVPLNEVAARAGVTPYEVLTRSDRRRRTWSAGA